MLRGTAPCFPPVLLLCPAPHSCSLLAWRALLPSPVDSVLQPLWLVWVSPEHGWKPGEQILEPSQQTLLSLSRLPASDSASLYP